MDDAWTVAIEALSWVERKRMKEDHALSRAIKQLDAVDSDVIWRATHSVLRYPQISGATGSKRSINT